MLALSAVPVIGWLIASVLCIFMAIPMYFLWNWLAPIYIYWLPPVYLDLPFWHVVGLIWLITMLKQLFLRKSSVTQNNQNKKDSD